MYPTRKDTLILIDIFMIPNSANALQTINEFMMNVHLVTIAFLGKYFFNGFGNYASWDGKRKT
jgi:hypothetical protein